MKWATMPPFFLPASCSLTWHGKGTVVSAVCVQCMCEWVWSRVGVVSHLLWVVVVNVQDSDNIGCGLICRLREWENGGMTEREYGSMQFDRMKSEPEELSQRDLATAVLYPLTLTESHLGARQMQCTQS